MDDVLNTLKELKKLVTAKREMEEKANDFSNKEKCDFKSADEILNHYKEHCFRTEISEKEFNALFKLDKNTKKISPLFICEEMKKRSGYHTVTLREVEKRKLFKTEKIVKDVSSEEIKQLLSNVGIKTVKDDLSDYINWMDDYNHEIDKFNDPQRKNYSKSSDELYKGAKLVEKEIEKITTGLFPPKFRLYVFFDEIYKGVDKGDIRNKEELYKYCRLLMNCITCKHYSRCERKPIENCNTYFHSN